ncbi:MAG TPA: M56 family metallopeptidase [Opitutaceae bacterium]|nr:M56 family metallopeptidase [Opitutaceae bacterium]
MGIFDFMLRLARVSVEAGVVVLLVLAAQQVFRRQLSPQWRCALWLLVVARLVPLSYPSAVSIFNALPAWLGGSAPTGPSEFDRARVRRAGSTSDLSDVSSAAAVRAASATPPASTLAESAAPNPANDTAPSAVIPGAAQPGAVILFWIWLGGVAALGGYVALASIKLHRRLGHLRPVADPVMARTLRSCCERLGLRRAPPVLESAEVATPALFGLFRPRLLLPHGFRETFSDDELRFVFLHELAHLRRRDLLLNGVVTALQIVHWFNPLVWLAFARWRVDREIACDALALSAAGADAARHYGRTMLRLLEKISVRAPQPALLGILESPRQLRRRMRMIAAYTPARHPLAAITIMSALAAVALTDAETIGSGGAEVIPPAKPVVVAATPAPAARHRLSTVTLEGEFIVFLVRASGSMLGETVDDAAARTGAPGEQKRRAPKWLRTQQIVHHLLEQLGPQTAFQIILFNEQATPLARVANNRDPRVMAEQRQLLERTVPRGGANLERAFAMVAEMPRLPSRVVLVTDALPTAGNAPGGDGETTEAQRRAFFEAATKQLPPRVPISTILLPLFPEDAAVAGSYWQLANATRGEFFAPAPGWPADAKASPAGIPTAADHVAFVIDSSGSMRDPNTGALWPVVARKVEEVLDSHPTLAGIQLLDGDGRFILGRRGNGAAGWHAATPELREQIKATLRSYQQDSVSNPVPGVANALRFLHDKAAVDLHMAIYVFGDEFLGEPRLVLDRLDELNPRGADGRRPVVISAVGFPTTIRTQYSMGNTGLKFASLMHRIAHEHGGMFVALQDL